MSGPGPMPGHCAKDGAAVAELDGDEPARVRLAVRASTTAAVLRALADDPSVTVRAAVALNPSYAPSADRRLLTDADERVRALLAGKVANLLPGHSGAEHAAAQAHVHQMLAALAGDAADRVRTAIAEAVRTMPEAPRALILRLANDPAVTVSDPVIRFSPLLTDADLLELLATPAHRGTAVSVASRTGLSASVADRIAVHADGAVIRALLANPSASIQEATLDGLIGRASDHPEWHEPLVRRPILPERAALALSRIVAGHLLELLARRADLSPPVAAALRQRVDINLDPVKAPPGETEVLDSVRRLNAAGALTEQALLDGAETGDNRLVAAVLAVASGIPLAALDRAVALRSAKALVSLVWRAGFSMRAAMAVQSALGQIRPNEQLTASNEGAFPLTVGEMEWQIELLGEPGR